MENQVPNFEQVPQVVAVQKKSYLARNIILVVTVLLFMLMLLAIFSPKTRDEVYKNSLLGYEIDIPEGWHVSESMSKKIEDSLFVMELANSVGCNVLELVEKYGNDFDPIKEFRNCLENNPELEKIESQRNQFLKNWKIETSKSIYLSQMNEEEENKLTTTDLSMPNENLTSGSFINIRPFESVLSFNEATSSNKSGLVRNFHYLADNTKAYFSDWRGTKISQNGLILSVPITTNVKLFNGESWC